MSTTNIYCICAFTYLSLLRQHVTVVQYANRHFKMG
ncbi:hypothetical protein EPYR_00714 [Erwinia pyrifoliae DSM 12163]|nr:hypothetical protein EPYR_00714 [Erwinia pyrifoliae DSM 12163]